MSREEVRDFYNRTASSRQKWKKRNSFYHRSLERYFSFIIPENSRVIEIGCGLGDLLHAVKPGYGVGIDFSPGIIEQARVKYPDLKFLHDDAEEIQLEEKFDWLIMSDLAGCLWDVQKALQNIRKLCHPQTRLVISNYNYLWEGLMRLGETLRIKLPQPRQNWLSAADINTLLHLEGFEVVSVSRKLLFPKYIPVINMLLNRFLANLPLVNRLNLVNLITARPLFPEENDFTVSIIIPARNERGNIENILKRMPDFGRSQELIFVEGHSSDDTFDEMVRVKNL